MLRDKIEKFVGHYLSAYSITCEKSKFIHDALWGTIEVKGYEQCILDTPLLQRLRQLHQTGCVFATYPSARHTRFEHTLGVMHIAGKIAEILQKRVPTVADTRTEQKVRFAAMLHDVGHSAFSHTSEEVYSQCGDLVQMTATGGEFEGKGAGEVLSYLVANSRAFRKCFAEIKKRHPAIQIEVDDFAPLILGRPSDPKKFFEAEIISGPFDADKLDYFPRDGRAAGISTALDIDRLLHCVDTAEVDRGNSKTHALTVTRGGFNAIQQLLFARATLFASVYHHHKVRACDCLIKACFERFVQKKMIFKRNESFRGVRLDSASDFLYLTDLDFFAEAYNQKFGSIEHDLIHSLLYRRLFKRVLTISSQTVDKFDSDDNQKATYGQFYNLGKNPVGRRELAKKIRKASGADCEDCQVWFDLPHTPSFDKAGGALINTAPKGETPILTKLSKYIPVKEWVDTYRQYYAQSFLFGPPDPRIRLKLAIEARKYFKDEIGLNLNDFSISEDIRKDVLAHEAKAAKKARQKGAEKRVTKKPRIKTTVE